MEQDKLGMALQAEYLHLQKTIEDFDARLISIKAWSVTFGMSALAGAFASGAPTVLLVASAASFLFWMLEIQWKFFQLAYYARSHAIEAHFRGAAPLPYPFQIGDAWYRSWSANFSGRGGKKSMKSHWQAAKRACKVMLWPHVMLPHAFVIAAGLLLFVLVRCGVIGME